MATNPVRIVLWSEPPLTADVAVGASVRLRAYVYDEDGGTLVNPDVMTATLAAPFVAATSPALVSEATGVWRLDVPVTSPGRWRIRVLAYSNPGMVGVGASSMEFNGVEAGI